MGSSIQRSRAQAVVDHGEGGEQDLKKHHHKVKRFSHEWLD
jgi:hypothetical protein